MENGNLGRSLGNGNSTEKTSAQICMRENGRITRSMGMASLCMHEVGYMKEAGPGASTTGLVNMFTKMAVFMKEVGRLVRDMGKVNMCVQMEACMRANGK